MMNETIRVLMRRDGISQAEAEERFNETLKEMEEAGWTMECEDILADNLGLEPDYIFDFCFNGI